MNACDFVYDGISLSSFGFIICEFDGGGGVQTANAGSEITFSTAPAHSGRRFHSVGTRYEKCLSASFQICKDPEEYDEDEMTITEEEFRTISRWLNRREFLWLYFVDYEDILFRASFNLSKIDSAKQTYGIQVEVTTDSPFCYGAQETVALSFSNGSLTKTFTDKNDEIGEMYPDVMITCGSAGDLVLTNDVTGCSFEVDNCVNGEVITQSGDVMILSTSSLTHDIANDFNYDFFRFGNTYSSRTNTVTASIPCTVSITYRPILKDTL